MWDALSGRLLATLEGHSVDVRSAAFSPDGSSILIASHDRSAKLWSVNGQLRLSLESPSPLHFALFSPDGARVLLAGHFGTAQLWDSSTGQLFASLDGHESQISATAFSPDGSRFITASRDETVKLWDGLTGQYLASLQGHERPVTAAGFNLDGTQVVTGSMDNTAKIWDVSDGRLLASLEGHTGSVGSVDFNPQHPRILTASSDGTAKLWHASPAGLSLFRLKTGKSATDVFNAAIVNSAVFNHDGTRLLTANGEDNVVRLWDGVSGKLLSSLADLSEVSLSGTGTQSRSGSDSRVGPAAAFGRDGARACSLGGDPTVRLWAVAERELLISWPAHQDRVTSAVFSPDGNRIATTGLDQTIKIWNVNGGLLASLESYPDAIRQPLGVRFLSSPNGGWHYAAFNPKGTHIVTAGRDGTTNLWDIASGEIEISLRTGVPRLVAFSPEGDRMLSVRSRSATADLWSTTTGNLLFSLEGHTSFLDVVAFHPDGSRIATAGADRTARLWDSSTGALLASLQGHEWRIGVLAFSPDGSFIVTGGAGEARIWGRLWRPAAFFAGRPEGHRSFDLFQPRRIADCDHQYGWPGQSLGRSSGDSKSSGDSRNSGSYSPVASRRGPSSSERARCQLGSMMNRTSPFQPRALNQRVSPTMMGRDILSLPPSTPTGPFQAHPHPRGREGPYY